MNRVVASIEARMGASRLPGKVLMELAGRPVLGRMLDRVRRARSLDAIVIATSDSPADDAIAKWAEEEGVSVFRGSEDNVLDRVLKAQKSMGADIVVELCGDCPLIDPAVIDRAIACYRESGVDLVTTTQPQSYPQGMDVEVFALTLLEEVAITVDDPAVHEHVSLHFYRRPDKYRLKNLEAPLGERSPSTRLLLDYPEDLEALNVIWRSLDAEHGDTFTTSDILALLRRRPELAAINAMRTEMV